MEAEINKLSKLLIIRPSEMKVSVIPNPWRIWNDANVFLSSEFMDMAINTDT
jgi:hypothetical protein